MTGARAAFAAAAASLAGTPFRLHGRDPQRGLDCVGVITASLGLIGRPCPASITYSLRQTDFTAQLALLDRAGFVTTTDADEAGAVIACAPGPAQLHFLVSDGQGQHIHAHASLRRVVITPAPLPWRIVGVWRLAHD